MRRILLVVLAAAGCGPSAAEVCSTAPECIDNSGCDVACRDSHVAHAACCDCLARHQVQDVVGDGVPPDENPACIPDADECAAALDSFDSISVSDFCTDQQCGAECSFLSDV